LRHYIVVGAVEVDTREELAAQTTKLRGHAGYRGGVDGAGDAARVGAARGSAGASKRRRDDIEDGEIDGISDDDDMDHGGDGEDGRISFCFS
jgi:hypothetical protein